MSTITPQLPSIPTGKAAEAAQREYEINNGPVPAPMDLPAVRPESKPERDSFGKFDLGIAPGGASKPKGSMNAAPIFGGSHPVKDKAAPAPKKGIHPDSKYAPDRIRA